MIHSSTVHSVAVSREQEYLEGWQRARAELDNMRRRMQGTIADGSVRVKQEVISEILPVADNFRATVEHVPDAIAGDSWVQGTLHVARQFDSTLEALGVTLIDPLGSTFDPREHEAVEQVAGGEQTSGQIVAVLQVGYKLGETVLRPARVKVHG